MTLGAETWTIIGTVLAVGIALATLIMRSTARLDSDRRAFQAEAAADRRHSDNGRVPRTFRNESAPRCSASPNASRASKARSRRRAAQRRGRGLTHPLPSQLSA